MIYCIHCLVSNEKYIGQTISSLKTRIRYHGYDVDKGSNTLLHQSIRQYGWDKHICGIVEETTNNDERECYWIDYYDTINNGMNMNKGGGAFPRLSGNNHPMKGKTHSLEARRKISDNHADFSGVKNGRACPWLIVFTDKTSVRVECLKEWCYDNGVKYPTIFNVLKGARRQKGPHKNILEVIKL